MAEIHPWEEGTRNRKSGSDPYVAKVMDVLKEGEVDDMQPLDRMMLTAARGACSYSAMEGLGILYPEVHFSRAMKALTYTMGAAYIITYLTHPEVFHENAFVDRMGYSNICIGIDTVPAKYVTSIGLQLWVYFNIRYAITDITRSTVKWKANARYNKGQTPLWWFRLCVACDLLYVLSSMIFSGMVMMVVPHHGTETAGTLDAHGKEVPLLDHHGEEVKLKDDSSVVWGHTLIFIQWIYCLCFMLILNFYSAKHRTSRAKTFFRVYILLCLVAPTVVLLNFYWYDKYGKQFSPAWVTGLLDWGWLLCNGMVADYLPLGEALVIDPNARRLRQLDPDQKGPREKAGEEALSNISVGYSLLNLALIPYTIISLGCSIFAGICRRAVDLVVQASPLVKSKSKDVPKHMSSYVGDIFGFIGLALNPGMGKGGYCNRWEHGSVCIGNVGTPVVFLGDLTASRVCVEGIDNRKHAKDVPVLTWQPNEHNAQPNFFRKGSQAVKVRDFFRKLLPRDATGPKWKASMDRIQQRVGKWAGYQVEDFPMFDVQTEVRANLIFVFITHLVLGEALDVSFVANNIFPLPQLSLKFPYIPNWLLPQYYQMKKAKEAVWAFFRNCPYAADIKETYESVGLTEIEAFEALLTAFTFHGLGMGNSTLNMLYYLPQYSGRDEMLEDDSLLTSFCYELLRNNGPPGMYELPEETTVNTSKGESYVFKKGTVCYANYSAVQRDETVYEDPHTFRADRFCPLPPSETSERDATTGAEPLPSMAFGCQLGKMHDEEADKHSHSCVFKHLSVHFLKGLASVLLAHDYAFDRDTSHAISSSVKTATTSQLSGSTKRSRCPFAFDISPDKIKGGADVSCDCTVPVECPRLQYFDRKHLGTEGTTEPTSQVTTLRSPIQKHDMVKQAPPVESDHQSPPTTPQLSDLEGMDVAEFLRLTQEFELTHKFVLFQGISYMGVGLFLAFGHSMFDGMFDMDMSDARTKDTFRIMGVVLLYIGYIYASCSQYAPLLNLQIRTVLGDPSYFRRIRLEPTDVFALTSVCARCVLLPVLLIILGCVVLETKPAKFLAWLILALDPPLGAATGYALWKKYRKGSPQ